MPRGAARPVKGVASQVAGFIAKFDAKNAKLIRACRAALRRRFPGAVELVYDNYNFLVFGFGATERASDAFLSLAAAASGVNLYFIQGARLPDPAGILLGEGTVGRFVRVASAETLAEPPVRRLIDLAASRARAPLVAGVKGWTIVKSVSAKQRPRRKPAK